MISFLKIFLVKFFFDIIYQDIKCFCKSNYVQDI